MITDQSSLDLLINNNINNIVSLQLTTTKMIWHKYLLTNNTYVSSFILMIKMIGIIDIAYLQHNSEYPVGIRSDDTEFL